MPFSKNLSRLTVSIAFACTLFAPLSASAWDGTQTGTIAGFDVTGGSNYGFRISMVGVTTMCTGGPNWAYLNDTDSNYKTYVAALMLAKTQGYKMTVYSTLEGAYCHIGYITIYPS